MRFSSRRRVLFISAHCFSFFSEKSGRTAFQKIWLLGVFATALSACDSLASGIDVWYAAGCLFSSRLSQVAIAPLPATRRSPRQSVCGTVDDTRAALAVYTVHRGNGRQHMRIKEKRLKERSYVVSCLDRCCCHSRRFGGASGVAYVICNHRVA